MRDGALRRAGQREMGFAALEALIALLEAGSPTPSRLPELARDDDRIVTLALTFGLTPLADATKGLCYMTALLRKRNSFDAEALGVHIRALRLFAPDSPLISDMEAALVLGRIAALAAHLASHLSAR